MDIRKELDVVLATIQSTVKGDGVIGALARPNDLDSCEKLRLLWFGKDGLFRKLFGQLKEISGDERVELAQLINEVKDQANIWLTSLITSFSVDLLEQELKEQFVDVTFPGQSVKLGKRHPISQIEDEVKALFKSFGFHLVDGPEVEEEYYCFDALNIPKHHPARDLQDTFYTDTDQVLRTHTTSVQARELEKGKLPIKVASAGRVYRNESVDATHSDMFHQYEALWVEPGLTLPHLTSLLTQIARVLYGRTRKIKFVPKFYPYTEPSLGMLIRDTKGQGWVTVAGAGMVHRKVFEEFGFDPAKVSGLAFGLGTSRLVSERFGIPNMRALYANDLRVLQKLV
jgi:phenylalanyl-tRNA synthetase alpha chain